MASKPLKDHWQLFSLEFVQSHCAVITFKGTEDDTYSTLIKNKDKNTPKNLAEKGNCRSVPPLTKKIGILNFSMCLFPICSSIDPLRKILCPRTHSSRVMLPSLRVSKNLKILSMRMSSVMLKTS